LPWDDSSTALWSPPSPLPLPQSVSDRWNPAETSCSPTKLHGFAPCRPVSSAELRAPWLTSPTACAAGALSSCSLRGRLGPLNCCSRAAGTRARRLPSVQQPRVPGLAVKGRENSLALISPMPMLLSLVLEIGAVIFI